MTDIASHLTNLGVEFCDLPEDALLSDAIVIVKYVETDGTVGMRVAMNPASSWIERIGMLRVALNAEEADIGTEVP